MSRTDYALAWPVKFAADPVAAADVQLRRSASGLLVVETPAGATARLDAANAPVATVTSLPGSPVDGQIVFYEADAANGVIWQLRYRAAATGSYKWEFVGGSNLEKTVDGGESVASTAAGGADLATVLNLTAPFAGEYAVSWGYLADVRAANGWIQGRLWVAGAQYGAATKIAQGGSAAAGETYFGTLLRDPKVTIAAAATDVRVKYLANVASVHFAYQRFLTVRPVRVG